MQNKYFCRLIELIHNFRDFNDSKIPLCAAENRITRFVNQPAAEEFSSIYGMGNLNRNIEADFIGSSFLFELFDLVSGLCEEIFNAIYADARTLSGMNCDLMVYMSVLKRGNRVLLTTPEQGGHASIPKLLDALGVVYSSVPYDYTNYQIDYDNLNERLNTNSYDAIIFCQSDLINVPDLTKCVPPEKTAILYDSTQTIGLIAGGVLANPLMQKNVLMSAGTHKTLPGPTCGLILCNEKRLINEIDSKITPDYIRNVQPDKIVKLILALIEQQRFGSAYSQKIIKTANLLGELLAARGLQIARTAEGTFTNTHQLFWHCDSTKVNAIYKNALKYNITLNKKDKQLLKGIRLGVQEIARFGWGIDQLEKLADLLFEISKLQVNEKAVLSIRSELLPQMKQTYTYHDLTIG